jgi:glycosyltransferase involved in cell wall biosynthesis
MDRPFDAVHTEGIEMAPYALSLTQNSKPKIQNSYDAHNAEYLLQRRAFTIDLRDPRRLPHALYSLVQWRRLRRYERELCLASKHILAVSPADALALSRLSPQLHGRITLLPNGVDPEYWSPGSVQLAGEIPPGTEALVFDGSMDFRPNVDAARWMVGEVWPLIRQERPRAQVYIVGRNPSEAVRSLAEEPGIHVTGEVDDTRRWVGAAAVYVVPMRMGGGVRLKVLQAMAMERAIVSTPMGAEGITVHDGGDIVLAARAQDFARAVLDLLSDPERRSALGREARELAVKQYAWEKLLPTLDKLYPRNIAAVG